MLRNSQAVCSNKGVAPLVPSGGTCRGGSPSVERQRARLGEPVPSTQSIRDRLAEAHAVLSRAATPPRSRADRFKQLAIEHEVFELPCGHYTTAKFPFNSMDGLRIPSSSSHLHPNSFAKKAQATRRRTGLIKILPGQDFCLKPCRPLQNRTRDRAHTALRFRQDAGTSAANRFSTPPPAGRTVRTAVVVR